jgi:putative MATE family efflux protein
VKDLTRDSIAVHLLTMAAPIVISMLVQIAYQLINLYFVSRLGAEATAGVNAAGSIMFAVSALSNVLATGTAVVIAHSIGGKDRARTNLLFNQSIVLSTVCAAITVMIVLLLIRPYMEMMSREADTVDAGIRYVTWASPAYALLFPMVTLSATLRGAGIIQPAVLIFALTIILNAILAPVFIAGWGIGTALGVEGGGLATSVAVAIGLVCMAAYFFHSQRYVSLQRTLLRPQWQQWRRVLAIGWPAGAELLLMFLSTGVVYFAIRDLGASAQAGFGIGWQILQTILLPGMSISSAAGPIAGQSFGARDAARVKDVFWTATLIGSIVMLATTILVQSSPTRIVAWFDTDAQTAATAVLFLQLMSWTFVAQGLVYTCANMFQGLGNTVPSLISATARFVVFAAPAAWASQQAGFQINQIWYLLATSVAVQAALSLWLLRVEFRRKLPMLG